MIIDDFIMLGRTVPEPSKRHGVVVCSAGYSKELKSFMRIYPLSPFEKIKRWSVCRIELKRNPQDSRHESWRIKEDTCPTIVGHANKDDEINYLLTQQSPSVQSLNENRHSLGIIKPNGSLTPRFDRLQCGEEYQVNLFPEINSTENRRPRLSFYDQGGKHDLQLRDWGCAEFLRKQSDEDHHKLWSALKLNNPSYEHILFVGNHAQHRNSWLVISLLYRKVSSQLNLLEAVA